MSSRGSTTTSSTRGIGSPRWRKRASSSWTPSCVLPPGRCRVKGETASTRPSTRGSPSPPHPPPPPPPPSPAPTPLQRLVDWIYLNSVGWRAIRQRKANLEKVLGATILNVLAEGKPVRLVDIAAGPGSYVLETLKTLSPLPIAALLRDRDPANLEIGGRLARELEVANVTYERGDAFDPASLATIAPPPMIAVVSGLYELFPDNDLIARSLGRS